MKNPLKTYISPYDFDPRLPATLTFADLNFFNPVVQVGLKAWIALTKAQVKGTKTPHFSLETGTGAIECYTVEPEDTERRPAILYCHGGGFMFPLQTCMLNNARLFADEAGVRVFLPNYRIAPKDPFPTPMEDCYRTYLYLLDHAEDLHIDPTKILVYGDSAGGALAAAVCQKARDEGVQAPLAQFLIYPVEDNSLTQKSLEEFAYGSWSKTANVQMWQMYLKNGDDGHRSYAAPLQATNFSNLPQAYVEPAGKDALRDEGIAYAEAMRQAGVPVELVISKDAYHGFDQKFKNPMTQEYMKIRLDYMKQILV